MIIAVAVILGILGGIFLPYNLTAETLPYVAVAIIAALDSVFGGLSANFNKRFNLSIFISGLVANSILAVALTFIGNKLGINLSFAVIVVFGVRIFNNLSYIRHMVFDRYFETKNGFQYEDYLLAIEGSSEEEKISKEEKNSKSSVIDENAKKGNE